MQLDRAKARTVRRYHWQGELWKFAIVKNIYF
nr:MAG TPA: hypothetical protein [Caudoviricetes sp.]